MRATESAIRGARVATGSRRPRRYGTGRVCSVPGCGTRISVYNPRETCFVHAGVRIPRLRGRR